MQHHFKIFIYNVYAKHTNSAMVIELRNNFRYFRKHMKKKRCEYEIQGGCSMRKEKECEHICDISVSVEMN